MDRSPRLGFCLDTCHLLAAGYDIRTRPGYDDVFASFDRLVGLDRVRLFHGNDSKRPLGSRLDRHEHIGQGAIGLEAFRWLVTDPRFADLALVIETHKTPGLCDHPKIRARRSARRNEPDDVTPIAKQLARGVDVAWRVVHVDVIRHVLHVVPVAGAS